jgi:peptidase S1 and S6 chymotrypsin/hap
MSENNLYGFDNENIENKNNEVNENITRQDEGLGMSNYGSTNYADFRQEPTQTQNSASTAANNEAVQHTKASSDAYTANDKFDYSAQSDSHIHSGNGTVLGSNYEANAASGGYVSDAASNDEPQFEELHYDNTYAQQSPTEHTDHENAYTQQSVTENENYNNAYAQQSPTEHADHDNAYTQSNTTESTSTYDNTYARQSAESKKTHKKGSAFKRIVGISAAALLFGTVAGGTMFGVNNLATNLMKTEEESTALSKKAPEVSSVELKEASKAVTTANNSSPTVADVSPIAESAMPSVVAIKGTTSVEAYSWFGEGQTYDTPSSGSGIIIGKNDTELLVVTNNHVVEDTKDLSVVFIDNEEVKASVKGRDSDNDIAIMAVKLEDIKPETLEKIAVAHMGDSDELKVGQGVVAIGNALGYGQSVTVGYVSAIDREVTTKDSSIKNLLQTDAAINPGNSGGALLNMNGEVIGINTAKYASTEVEGMGYAIPISKVKDIIAELSSKETRSDKVDEAKQGYLGIQGKNIGEDVAKAYDMPRGIYVYKIVENSSAANSDLREKDIITKVDSQPVKNMEELKELLSYYQSGEKVKLTVQRLKDSEYEEKEIEITLSDRSALQ